MNAARAGTGRKPSEFAWGITSMRSAAAITLGVTLLAGPAACRKDRDAVVAQDREHNSASTTSDADYFPISPHASWSYKVEYTQLLAGSRTAEAVKRVDGTETIDGKVYFKSTQFVGFPGASARTGYERRGSEGVFNIDPDHKDRGEFLEFPFPLGVGKTWTVGRTTSGVTYSNKVESIETLEVLGRPIKDCLKISYRGTDGRHGFKWLAKGVGMVKQTHHPRDGATLEYVLQKYEP